MPLNYFGNDLINIELIKDQSSVFFKLSDRENQNSITFDYTPKLDDEYKVEDYELILFENLYLTAENDVFQLFEREDKLRLGWIFPLTNLESNENNFSDNEFLNKYKFVAFQLLLKAKEISIELDKEANEFKISDIYDNNPIIIVLSKVNVSKIANFSIEDYLPSLSKYGYYIKNTFRNKIVLKPKEDFCVNLRGSIKIQVTKAKINIIEDRFFHDLFSQHLKILDHHLIRFHILYQIIEYILTQRFSIVFSTLITAYNNSTIAKNDFIEEINGLGKERVNLKKIVEHIKTLKHDFDEVNLERDCRLLLEPHKSKIKNSLGDLIYDTRNLIVHSYRNIDVNELELIENITHQLELLTINIIESYIPGDCE